MAVSLINSLQSSLTEAITKLSVPGECAVSRCFVLLYFLSLLSSSWTLSTCAFPAAQESPSTLSAAVSHLDSMFAAVQQLTGSDSLDLAALLPPLCETNRHATAAICLLRPELATSADLRLAARRVANVLPVFCSVSRSPGSRKLQKVCSKDCEKRRKHSNCVQG